MSANEKDLKSLKVYGNDDPAGSVYKVSGGGSDKMALSIFQDESGLATVKYLAYLDGSSVTWEEIYDAMLHGIAPVVVSSGDQDGTGTGVYHVRVLSAYIKNSLHYVTVENDDTTATAIQSKVFSALTESDRLELRSQAPLGPIE